MIDVPNDDSELPPPEAPPDPRRRYEFAAHTERPAQIPLTESMLRSLAPFTYGSWAGLFNLFFRGMKGDRFDVRVRLWFGEASPAFVSSLDPFRVTAYAERLDDAVVLDFDPTDLEHVRPRVGQRLLAVNWYRWQPGADPVRDIVPGPHAQHGWVNVQPIIAESVSAYMGRIGRRKFEIEPELWEVAAERCEEAARRAGDEARSGDPLYSWMAPGGPAV